MLASNASPIIEGKVNQKYEEKLELIIPTTRKFFFEYEGELQFCKPHLMPLKSRTLEHLERMQRETASQLLIKQATTIKLKYPKKVKL